MHYENEPHAHYLTFSCYNKLWLFKHPQLYDRFVKHLGRTRDRLAFKLWAFVVMPNHVHLLIYPNKIQISNILYAIKRPFSYQAAQYLEIHFTDVWKKIQVEHAGRTISGFWQRGGGYDRNIFGLDALRKNIQYIHFNPVRKGIVESPLDWKWSGAHFWEKNSSEPIPVDKPWFWKE